MAANVARACRADRKYTSARLGRPDLVDLYLPPISIQSTAKRPERRYAPNVRAAARQVLTLRDHLGIGEGFP